MHVEFHNTNKWPHVVRIWGLFICKLIRVNDVNNYVKSITNVLHL